MSVRNQSSCQHNRSSTAVNPKGQGFLAEFLMWHSVMSTNLHMQRSKRFTSRDLPSPHDSLRVSNPRVAYLHHLFHELPVSQTACRENTIKQTSHSAWHCNLAIIPLWRSRRTGILGILSQEKIEQHKEFLIFSSASNFSSFRGIEDKTG